METIAERIARFEHQHPEIRERIEREVSQWPPMSSEAVELWKAAKLNYLKKLEEQQP